MSMPVSKPNFYFSSLVKCYMLLACQLTQLEGMPLAFPGFEIWCESKGLICAKNCQNHSMRVDSDSHQNFVRLLSSDDNFHNNLLLNA